jgi:hypothetical protein
MDVYSMELGIRLSLCKNSEFRGVGVFEPPPPHPLGTPLAWTAAGSPLASLKWRSFRENQTDVILGLERGS